MLLQSTVSSSARRIASRLRTGMMRYGRPHDTISGSSPSGPTSRARGPRAPRGPPSREPAWSMLGKQRGRELSEDRSPFLEAHLHRDRGRRSPPARAWPRPRPRRSAAPSSGQEDGGPHRGVPRERDLDRRREDTHARGALIAFGRAQEDGLREVHLPRDLLHELGRQMRGVREDAQRVAAEGAVREDVQRVEGEPHGHPTTSSSRRRSRRATDCEQLTPAAFQSLARRHVQAEPVRARWEPQTEYAVKTQGALYVRLKSMVVQPDSSGTGTRR
jgi:hypothetical protein